MYMLASTHARLISSYLPPIKPQSWKIPNPSGMYNGKYDIIFYSRDSGILGIWKYIEKILVLRVTSGKFSVRLQF